MTAVRAQIILKTTDANPENYVTNTLAFDYTLSAGNIDATTAAIKGFYDAIWPTMIALQVAQNGHMVKYYALPGTKPNYPQDEQTFNLSAAPSGAGLPSEVALCLSFQGNRVAGQAQARKQGRIYIGPLRETVNLSGRPGSAFRTTLSNAAAAFGTAISTNTDGFWGVWSGTNLTVEEITNGWVDDSFDTQRRRGLARTTRTIWSL